MCQAAAGKLVSACQVACFAHQPMQQRILCERAHRSTAQSVVLLHLPVLRSGHNSEAHGSNRPPLPATALPPPQLDKGGITMAAVK